jgi:hypothetical protein
MSAMGAGMVLIQPGGRDTTRIHSRPKSTHP